MSNRSSTSKKLVQAAALATLLVPLGSVAVESASITCGFGESYGDVGSGSGCTSSTPSSSRFDFGDYFFELAFSLVGPDFEVTVETTPSVALAEGSFPGYECIELSATDGCVDFRVITTGAAGTHWTDYTVTIDWSDWNDLLFPGIEPRMRMLHDRSAFDGPEPPGTYDFDMCITPGLYDACEAFIEPGIRSGDTDFDSFIAALAPATVPEPASVILLATGASAALYRKRRRSRV
jgi:PEP-CTERM motif-containing protein